MHGIRIDRAKPLAAEPHLGHNRYHPDIPPIAEIGEGEEIALETRDALDGQIKPGMAGADLASVEAGVVHPLTGPVFVKGAQPGDALEIEFTDIIAQPTAFSAIVPGLGFLRDLFTEPFLVHWQIADGWASSAQIPGARIPGAPFMGVSAVAPSAAKLAEWTLREQRVIDRGGFAFPPDPAGAVPTGRCGLAGLRPLPPRENGGNFDAKQLTKGAKLFLPVYVEGGLFLDRRRAFRPGRRRGLRDGRRDGRPAVVRFKLHKGLANRRKFISPAFTRDSYFAEPRFAAPECFLGVMGMPINAAGEIEAENLTLACRNAVLNMIELLRERPQLRAGLCDLLGSGRLAHLQRRRRAQLRRLGLAARGHLRRRLSTPVGLRARLRKRAERLRALGYGVGAIALRLLRRSADGPCPSTDLIPASQAAGRRPEHNPAADPAPGESGAVAVIDSITEWNWPWSAAFRISSTSEHASREPTDEQSEPALKLGRYGRSAAHGGCARGHTVAALGTLSQRTAVGNRPRRLQRARGCVGILAA
jgi:formamidase